MNPRTSTSSERPVAESWLEPVRLEDSVGFGRTELRTLERIVVEHADAFVGAWHDFFAE